MSIGKVTSNINLLLAEAMYNKLRIATNDETYYAAVAFSDSEDYISYSSSDSDTSEFFGGADSEFAFDDQAFYSQNTLTLHRVLPGGVMRCVPRNDWVYGRTYQAWPSETNFYVMVKEFVSGIGRLNVYKCLFSPNKPSYNPPTGVSATAVTMSDEYVWQYLYSISNSESIRFVNDEYIPVPEKVTAEEALTLLPGTPRYLQYAVQENSELGSVYGFSFDSDALLASRDSDWALGNEIIVRVIDSREDSDLITRHFDARISYDSENNRFLPRLIESGEGYQGLLTVVDQDKKKIPGITARIAGGLGHGSSAPEDLNATNIMLVSRNIPQDEFLPLAQGSYRMANLIRNPIDTATNRIGSQDFYVACKSFICDDISTFTLGEVIQPHPVDDGRRGRVVAVDHDTVYYVNHIDKKERDVFVDSESIVLDDGINKIHTIKKKIDRQVIFNSGEIILSDFKTSEIVRSKDQIESINFVLSF